MVQACGSLSIVIRHSKPPPTTHLRFPQILHSYLCQQNNYDMRYSITFLGIFIFSLIIQDLSAQESLQSYKELTIGAGIGLVNITDSRMSAISYSSVQPTYHLGYKSQSEKTVQEFQFDFTLNQKRSSSRLLDLNFTKPSFSYSLEKKVQGIWLGGVFNSTTLLTSPLTRTGHFNNNPISYTIANSIGPKISLRKAFMTESGKSRYELNTTLEAALLGYVIRPGFGHPYPEQYLESGIFSPTKAGMAGPLLKSGKVLSIGKFQSFKVVIGLSYHVSDNFKLGARLNLDYHSVSSNQPASMMATDLLVTASYIY